ncbi:MAG: hypothetical protein WC679_01580 [Bacteroidales bacterium]|jgi:hypothetical protein
MNIQQEIQSNLPELAIDLEQFYNGYAILETPTLNNLARVYANETGIPFHIAKDNIIKMTTLVIVQNFNELGK